MTLKTDDFDVVSSEVISALAKEVKFYKTKVQELEQTIEEQICSSCSSEEMPTNVKRGESVEIALQFLNDQVERLTAENAELQMEKGRRDSASVKSEPKEESSWQDHAQDNEENLESVSERRYLHYKTKYKIMKAENTDLNMKYKEIEDEAIEAKAERSKAIRKLQAISEENDQLKRENRKLDTELMNVRQQFEDHKNSLTNTSKSDQLQGQADFCNYMQQFPSSPARPQFEELEPVCSIDADLTEYLVSDRRTVPYVKDVLYLPGMFSWTSSQKKHHGLGCGPTYVFNTTSVRWEKNPQFHSLYGCTVELFFKQKEHIYYAGIYKCHNLRRLHEDGAAVFKSISFRAISEATFNTSSSKNSKTKTDTEINQVAIDQLYRDGILSVEYVGLECIGYNRDFLRVLKERFEYTIIPSKRGPQSNIPLPAKKKKV